MYTIYINNNDKRETTDSWTQALALADIYRAAGDKVWIEDETGKAYC